MSIENYIYSPNISSITPTRIVLVCSFYSFHLLSEWFRGIMTDRNTPRENTNRSVPTTTTNLTETLEALRRPERRAVLLYFHRSGTETADVVELTEFVSERTDGLDDNLTQLSLNQHHLPKLADCGFIDYDQRSGAVRCYDTVSELLELFVE